MRAKIGILFIAVVLLVIGCTDTWDEHYNKQPETINTNVWDAIKNKSELSKFVELMVKFKYDTLFLGDDTYTIFAPNNSAISKLTNSDDIAKTILNYHIAQHYVQPVAVQGKRKLQTLAEKFSTFEYINGKSTYDGLSLSYESPLYLNGKFFIMNEAAMPKPNLYEYYSLNNTYLKTYIDKQDSIVLDMEKSVAIGFDEKGRTVYDTVAIKLNKFEMTYFPISKEMRSWTATLVYPRQIAYENALTVMAQKLGGNFHDYKDIPVKWQESVLIPQLLKHGVFLNMMEPSEFKEIRFRHNDTIFNMANINGDSIVVNYSPIEKSLCSNGVTYDYAKFVVPDSLFSGTEKFEGEWLLRTKGTNTYDWRTNVIVTATPFVVAKNWIKGLSNDSILIMNFTKGYKGSFNLQFNVKNLFPRKYRVVVGTHMDIGGIYEIYVNNVLVRTFDTYDFIRLRSIIPSVDGKTRFTPYPVGSRYNKFDFYVDNITEYGKPEVRFVYKGPGLSSGNGLVIDALEFVPVL
jgi:hypothetical protein